jgi:nicotinamide-nucleotide amidase
VARAGDPGVIVSRVLKTWGESESGLNDRLDDIVRRLDGDTAVTLAFLARGWNGLEIRLTTRAASGAAGAAVLGPLEEEIRARLGTVVFGADGDSMESVVLEALRRLGWTVALAESLTAGMVAARLAGVSGASDVLRGGVVSYASDVKFELLGVPPGPVVTEETALAMADGARRTLRSDVGLALTGVAGPLAQPGEPDVPVGTVCLAASGPSRRRSTTLRLGSNSGREQVRQFAVINALDLLRRMLLEEARP